MHGVAHPPERVELGDVGATMRRHAPDDLDVLQEAIEASRDHLRSFMPWADQSRDETATFLRGAVAQWETGESFGYLLVDAMTGRAVGGSGLHRRVGPVMAIGYWRRADGAPRALITVAARVLTDLGLALPGIERVEIRCDVANAPSAAVPRRLGYQLAAVVDEPAKAPGETGRQQVWTTVRSDAGGPTAPASAATSTAAPS